MSLSKLKSTSKDDEIASGCDCLHCTSFSIHRDRNPYCAALEKRMTLDDIIVVFHAGCDKFEYY